MIRSKTPAIPLVALTGLLALACTEAESRDAPDADRPEVEARRTVPVGTSLTFIVDENVSTEEHQVGDAFTATLSSNVTDVEGSVVLEEGAPSRWIVTQSTTEDGQTLLAVNLEAIRIDGEWVPVVGTVTEADLETDAADSKSETAAKIGVGAAAGAIIGQIVGRNTESTLKGAGLGAAVGTAVALTTRGGSAVLPQGAAITVLLDEPIVVS